MTNRNSSWNNQPFLLKPVGKDYLWGGSRLKDDFSKNIDMTPLAETWECSTHPDGLSLVSGGIFDGKTLKNVLEEHPEFAGSSLLPNGELPILIKLIDAKEDLSVQVHPDDEYAHVHEHGSLGKNEMWYVLDAASGTRLVYGFNRDIDKITLEKNLRNGTIAKYLQYVPIQKDDVFYIEPGQVHAIGAGALIAEIQENSNVTYRLYDYDRKDKNGRLRPLHIEKALDVANLHGSAEPRQPMRVLRYQKGCASELLCRCKYFQVERLLINTEKPKATVDCRTSENSFQVLLCVEGHGKILPKTNSDANLHVNPYSLLSKEVVSFSRGDCIFVPAGCETLKLDGKAQLLKVGC